MTGYEGKQRLFQRLLGPACPSMHWGDNAGWEIADAQAAVVKAAVVKRFKAAKFMSVSLDEGTSVDNKAVMSVHGYIISADWLREPFFLQLAGVRGAPDAANLTGVLLTVLRSQTGLTDQQLARAVVGIGCDGASVLQGKHNGVVAQLKIGFMPWLSSSWCFAHRGQLAAGGMKDVAIVGKLTAFVHEVSNYFSASPKRADELFAAHTAAGTKGNKIIQDVTTRWISLLPALQSVCDEWPALMLKLWGDKEDGVPGAASMYSQLVDVELFLGAHALLPLLTLLNSFLKACQARHVFVNDLSDTLSSTRSALRSMFIAKDTRFKGAGFSKWSEVSKIRDTNSPLRWGEENLVMHVDGEEHTLMARAPRTGRAGRPCVLSVPISSLDQLKAVRQSVTNEMLLAADLVSQQLVQRFPPVPLMEAMSVVYAEYWEAPTESGFREHLDTLIKMFGKSVVHLGCKLQELLNPEELMQQSHMFFELATVAAAYVKSLDTEEHTDAPTTLLWRHLTKTATTSGMISEFVKLAELVLVLVPGSVEEERTFSTMGFIKDRLRNRLGQEHLNTTVSLKTQQVFTIDTFPFRDAITEWKSTAEIRGRYGPSD